MDIDITFPIIRPVPIKTRGLFFWDKIKAWLFTTRKWEVVEDYYLHIPWFNLTIKIPKGFIFDGASIPRILWPFLSPTGILFIPGIVHDYGYKYNRLLDENGNFLFVGGGQKFFDKLFGKLGKYINDMVFL